MRYGWLCICMLLAACSTSKYKGVPEKYDGLLDTAFSKAGENAGELKNALNKAELSQKEGVAFLIAYMPERDLRELKADFLLENVEYAYKAREKYPWAKKLPDSIFFNDVLPYASLNESRDAWRKDFFERFGNYVVNCKTIFEAIDSVNQNIRDEVMVDYNTKREKPDQSPYESIRQHMASCSGLSILLTDAFRAVGIPSRVAGTPNWHDGRGNHNWCEVWAEGEWYFTEYYPNRLNDSWFLTDAGQADKNSIEKAIYASSFKPASTYFPLVWDENIRYVHAENVTDRYVDIYKQRQAEMENDGKHIPIKVYMFKNNTCSLHSDDRVAANVDIFCGEDQIGGGRTAAPTQDMNDVLEFLVEKNKTYTFRYADAAGNAKAVEVEVKEEPKDIKLYMN